MAITNNASNGDAKRAPAFVAIYEDLYDQLDRGDYRPGDQLPTEATLAEQYGVSRNTLRQALAILREDGRIYNVQGRGSFVCKHFEQRTIGFEKLFNPAFDSATTPCTGCELNYHFAPTALVVQQKMNLRPSDVALVAEVRFYHEDIAISYTFLEIPVKYLSEGWVDLNDDECVKRLVTEWIFEKAASAFSRVTFTIAEENISRQVNIEQQTQMIFIEEILYDVTSEAIALCKHYLLPEYYSISLTRRK